MGCVRLEFAALQVTFMSRWVRVRGPKVSVLWGSSGGAPASRRRAAMVLVVGPSVVGVLVALRGSRSGSEVVLKDSDSISLSSTLVPSVHSTQGRGLPEGGDEGVSGLSVWWLLGMWLVAWVVRLECGEQWRELK